MAIARKMLIAIWYVLRGEPFKELGGNYLDTLDPKRLVRAITRRMEALGFDVTVTRKVEVQTV
jgi:hypothetical protein